MARKLTNSNAHFKNAVKRLPLGVASNFRYWGEGRTIYVKQGRGARIVDIDDNNYVDYRMGYGPAILGYADERVDAAARDGMSVGGVFALSTERDVLRLLEMILSQARRISGSDAGSVYLAESGGDDGPGILRLELSQNASRPDLPLDAVVSADALVVLTLAV